MPTARVGEIEVAYEDVGGGDPVLLIPGTGASAATWVGQTMELSERWRCVTPDNRDCGASSTAEGPYTPRDMAADSAGLVEALGLGPVHVVGHSLGGAIAQELSLARPDLVRSLVLLATWPATDGWFAAEMRGWQALRRHHADDEEAFLRALFPWVFGPASYGTPGLVDGFVTFGLAAEPRQPPEAFCRQCDADIAHDAGERLRGVGAPTLVMVGEDDICTPPRYARALAELIPGAELAVLPAVAHGLLFERPDLVNEAVAGFLGKH